VYVANSEPAIW